MCDSSLSKPSIVANLRNASVAVQCFQMAFDGICLLQALLGFAAKASCHSRSASVCRPYHATVAWLCYSSGLTFRLVALDQAGPLSKCVQMPLTCVPAVQD